MLMYACGKSSSAYVYPRFFLAGYVYAEGVPVSFGLPGLPGRLIHPLQVAFELPCNTRDSPLYSPASNVKIGVSGALLPIQSVGTDRQQTAGNRLFGCSIPAVF